MNTFLNVLESRQDILLEKIWEHLQISIISLLIAVIVAVPLGILLTRNQKIAEPVIGVTAVIQTIPSLAVLAFLIPAFGIGREPAIIALTAYGLLPILRNTYTGIKEVDPALIEASTGLGMSSIRRLMKIELPLAMPVIMAGIRTSMVLIVGTTTIAALIGAGGLGELILLGLDRGADVNLILLGAIPAALLAILLDYLLRFVEKRSLGASLKPMIGLLIAAILVVAGPLLFQSANQKPDLVIGGKLGSEPEILINMYKLLIEKETDLEVALEPGLGKTSFVFDALQLGDIDIYPEFTGTAIVTHLGQEAVSNDRRDVYEQAKKGMASNYDMAFLEPMAFNNTYAVAVRGETAKRYDLKTIGDLQKVDDQLVAGFTLEFSDREDGYVGIKRMYGVEFADLKTMEPGIRQTAISEGDVDVIDAYSTSGYMVDLDLTVLKDDKNLFPPYQGAPLLLQERLDEYPELERILNQLSGKITDDEMREMNYQVDYEDVPPEEVAREFLQEEGLL